MTPEALKRANEIVKDLEALKEQEDSIKKNMDGRSVSYNCLKLGGRHTGGIVLFTERDDSSMVKAIVHLALSEIERRRCYLEQELEDL